MAKLREPRFTVRMRKATEDFIETHSVEDVRAFIVNNGVVEEDDDEVAMFIPKHEHKFVKGKTYDMVGTEFKYDEFIITTDGRVFFSLALNNNIEIID